MYNEKLVARGEAYVSLDFIKSEQRNREIKQEQGWSTFNYSDSLMMFLAYLHILLSMDYRGLEGFLKGLAKLVIFNVPDYSTICRRKESRQLSQ